MFSSVNCNIFLETLFTNICSCEFLNVKNTVKKSVDRFNLIPRNKLFHCKDELVESYSRETWKISGKVVLKPKRVSF